MTARVDIRNALIALFKSELTKVVDNNITGRLKFWDEVQDFPYLCVVNGPETREYQPGGFSWCYLNVKLWIFVKSEDPEKALDDVLTELESVIDLNNDLEYSTGKFTTLMSLSSITTDEGILAPQGVGQINLIVQYSIDRCP